MAEDAAPAVGWHADPSDSTVSNHWDGARWSARKKWTGTGWVDVDAAAPSGSSWAAPVPAGTGRGSSSQPGWTELHGVPAIQGRFSEYGDSITEGQVGYTWTRYSYIQIGDQAVGRVMVMSGLKSKLLLCLGTDCTLYLSGAGGKRGYYLIGVSGPDGVTYTSDFPAKGLAKLGTPLLVIMGVATLPLCGLGLFPLYVAKMLGPLSRAHSLAKRIPNARELPSA